jgi:co-chaperonin GroES (HSP10)
MVEILARPRAGQVFVERIKEKKSDFILAPETIETEDTTFVGRVLLVGPGVTPQYTMGDKVLFRPWQAHQITIGGLTVFTVPETDILGVFTESK